MQKITLYIFLLFSTLSVLAQVEGTEITAEDYNGFSTRNFMKFNSFLTVPTFSVLHRENQTIEAITRSSNIEFEDASRLHLLSYSGKMREGTGAGIAVFQQEIGVFKDFGAVVNYAHQLKLGKKTKLALGFNFFYSRRSLDNGTVLTQQEDELISNFQDIPIINLQPAVTFSYGKFNVGVFLEDLVAFNLKENELSSGELTEKTISGHLGYATKFNNFSGLLKDSYVRVLGIARSSDIGGFTYAGNILMDLPKAGWLKVGYDNLYGINAGFGVNLSEKLSIGFGYEKQDNLGATSEVGLLYTLGRKRNSRKTTRRKPRVEVLLPEPGEKEGTRERSIIGSEPVKQKKEIYEDPEHEDLSGELERMQDSLNRANKKLNEILDLLKKQPRQVDVSEVKTTETKFAEPLDTSLRRSSNTPWSKKEVTKNGGGGGTMYYVAVDQFKDIGKAKALVESYKKRDVKVKYVKEPKTNAYFVYVNRHAKKEDAEEEKEEVNVGGGYEKNDNNSDLQQIKVKKVYKAPVYVVKITLGAEGETYKEAKTQPRARVRTMKLVEGLEPGYYLQVNVYSKKPYADKFLDELRNDGINANYFINPSTGYRHVYILKSDDREEAIRLYNNNLNNSYYDRKSIINIK